MPLSTPPTAVWQAAQAWMAPFTAPADPPLWPNAVKSEAARQARPSSQRAAILRPDMSSIPSDRSIAAARTMKPDCLQSAYQNSLKLAGKKGLQSISFPAISCGIYGYPIHEAAHLALKTCVEFVRENTEIQLIRHVLFDQRTFDIFAQEFKKLI